MTPLVSVLMSVHNESAEFIDTAVNSICEQTYRNLEIIIINDASNDYTRKFLEDISASNSFIRLYHNQENIGLTATLNRGLKLCRGKFIARMDADDFSLPDRIEKQIEFLYRHPEIDILGTGVISFGREVRFMSPMMGYTPAEVQSQLFFTSTLCHPSVMIRKDFLDRNGLIYDETVKKGQDFDLWERSSVHGKLAVHPDVLLYYRLHPNQITSTHSCDQRTSAEIIIRRRLNRIGLSPTEREYDCHMALKGIDNNSSLKEINAWITKLITHSKEVDYIDSTTLAKNLYERQLLVKLKRHNIPSITELPKVVSILCSRIRMESRLCNYRRKINIMKQL